MVHTRNMKTCVLIIGLILCCYGSGSFGVTATNIVPGGSGLTTGSIVPTLSQGSSPTTVTPLTTTKPTTSATTFPKQTTTTTTPKPTTITQSRTTTTTPNPTITTPKMTTTTHQPPMAANATSTTPKPTTTTSMPNPTTTTSKPTTMLTTNTPPTTTKSQTTTKPSSSSVASTTATPIPGPPKTTPSTPAVVSSTTLAPNGTTAGTASQTPASSSTTSNATTIPKPKATSTTIAVPTNATTNVTTTVVAAARTNSPTTVTTMVVPTTAASPMTTTPNVITAVTTATAAATSAPSSSTHYVTTAARATHAKTTSSIIAGGATASTTTSTPNPITTESSPTSPTQTKYMNTKVAPVDPCTSYKPLPKAEFRGGNCHYNISNEVCDQTLDPSSWYVVQGPVGYLVMQESPADFGTCGTNFPIWMNDTHPSISEGVVDSQVCQADLTDSCSKATTIKVKNCTGFYVYQLPATRSCPEGYCFGGTDMICSPFECGNVSNINHGNVNYRNGTAYPSTADITCDSGYVLDPSSASQVACLPSGNWTTPLPLCIPKECGQPRSPANGAVVYTSTTYNSSATYRCHPGYNIEGNAGPVHCRADGTWSYASVACAIKDCGDPRKIDHGDVRYTNTTFDSQAFYSCGENYMLSGKSVIRCRSDGEWTNSTVKCVIDKKHIRCKENVDDRRTTWNETKPGEVVVINCAGHLEGQKDLTGDIKRQCGEDGIWKLPKYDCVSQEFLKIETQVDELIANKDPNKVNEALHSLSKATSESGISDKPLFGGELKKATTLLDTIADVSSGIKVSENQSQNFIDTASNLLDPKNQQSWEAVSDTDDDEEKKSAGAGKVLEVIDKYANAIANTLKESNETKRVVENKNMALQVTKIDTAQDIKFPDKQLKKISTKSTIALKKEDLKDVTSYSAVVYKNLSGILPPESNNNSKTTQSINSMVLSLDLHGGSTTLKSNVIINLEHAKKGLVQPVCSFWNTTLVAWDSRGCSLVSTSESLSMCQCSHLTNFAILMSPWTDNIVTKALDVISTVGCSVSLAALIITVAMHVILWRYMKSDRTVILMNLSIALVVSYVVFIAGVDRTENEDVCTSVAVVLQYIYLVVFFLMLVEGIDLAVTVLYVFHTKSRTKWMLPLAWGVPVVIVGISLGATQLKGYGTDDFCWLSIEDGLIWGFVGPALCIILVNIVLLILILRAMFSAKSLSARSKVAKVKTGVKSLCVLLPLIGSTWVLGMLYVNKDFAWVQYVFSVCNSLQGLVIFIFHCAFNPQMRVALQKRRKKYFDSQSLKLASTKQFSMPRVSTSSFSHSESDDRPYSRSISQDSWTCELKTPSLENMFTAVQMTGGPDADYHQPDYPMSGLHSFSSSRSANHYTELRF